MKVLKSTSISVLFIALAFKVCIGSTDFRYEEKSTIQKVLEFSNPVQQKQVQVDNVFGSINIAGYNGSNVQLLVHKTIRAKSQRDIEYAKKEVELLINEEDNLIDLYVDGPFRDRDHRRRSSRIHHNRYQVYYDFELKVPHQTDLFLETVNDGEIVVKNVQGEFDVENINGGVELASVAGFGRVYALNGEVKVTFTKNPTADSYFGSLNGDVEVVFQKNLSADFLLKTFNGDIYTDFPVTYIARKDTSFERDKKKGKYVYKTDRSMAVRVKNGGPEYTFDGFNGDIKILQSN